MKSRVQLADSRARLVAAADHARRRIERDLHDGVQQQLVALALELRIAEEAVPPELTQVRTQLAQVATDLRRVTDELQEISRGIHPAILSEGGLRPALRALARRSITPVELDVDISGRLPEQIEAAAYYIASEALTNVAKHASTSTAYMHAVVHDGTLHLSIRDDGAGGATPGAGSGLIGLTDRVEALRGTISISSPRGAGTTVRVDLPVRAVHPAVSSTEIGAAAGGDAPRAVQRDRPSPSGPG
ncbi:hypothetical protein GCM10023320_82180 [Pseudonocardia adelaidensis]|uniref:Oxygen sensor histidine kinase NreB n=2 Tax=Pseudonocardia adelaidensis TaxID=648754 RepID=A0ABP9P9J4_9PSEU